MSYSRLRPPATAAETVLTEERLAELRAVLPEVFADGRINWDTLRETLAPLLEDDEPGAEHFGLFWPGKREARRLAALPSRGALHPAVGEGVNEQATRNVFIEGDNLEVLKLLLKSYAGQVKMIYIDPPYNTGNDFVYRDDYSEPLEAYLRRTEQTDDAGVLLTTNSQGTGRFHSNWLSMMLPRMRLAYEFLQDDGLIFVSIDDNEQYHLRALMNEVFGEGGFVGVLVWQAKKGGGSDNDGVVADHEYVLCYTKPSAGTGLSRISVTAEPLDKMDNKGPYRRGRELNKWGANSRREDRPTMYFPIRGPHGEDVYPIRNDGKEGRWRWGKPKMEAIVAQGDVEFVIRPDGTYVVYEKVRTTDPRSKPHRTWLEGVGTTADGTKTVRDLFDGHNVFDFAKPVDLLKHLISMGASGNDDIVLDFFAGSCTTAQALLELNETDGGNRQFICVQMPEATGAGSEARKLGLKTIADIGKERIRRVVAKMQSDQASRLLEAHDGAQDLGFRVYKLGPSDVRPWRDYDGDDVSAVEGLFASTEHPLVDGWTPGNVLTEALLLQGFPLDSALAREQRLRANAVTRVTSDAIAHALYICLDEQVTDDTIMAICDGEARLETTDIFVCLDSALSDEAKLRLADVCNLQTI